MSPSPTPNFDSLAAEGVRFSWALSHAPTTLPSHAAVFTGRDSHGHAVPRNGSALGADLPTLAERLRARGYDTAGVVGASVLGSKTGIDRGFERWHETYQVDRGRRQEALAEEVNAQALAELRRSRERPLFLFVHYFDAHAPYAAPEPWTRKFCDPRYTGPFDGGRSAMKRLMTDIRQRREAAADVAEARCRYLGELAYVDGQLGRLLAAVRPGAVVAVFADHGELLGEDRLNPLGHGGYADVRSIHVPLALRGPGVPAARVVERPARLMDLGATLLALAGDRSGLGEGVDLAEAWTGTAVEPAPASFAEASQPTKKAASEGWPNLPFHRSVVSEGLIYSRWPLGRRDGSLARLQAGEPPVDDASASARQRSLLDAWDAAAPALAVEPPDAETQAALEALGYSE
jgi:arylsulfatase A-like enzyme